MKYSFRNDYSEACHPKLLEALGNLESAQIGGYGEDSLTEEARQLIRNRLQAPDAGVYFVSGGTQANLLTIAAFLRPHESVICADSGHIHVHEAGAIEATGHKVLGVPSPDGKLRVQDIEAVLEEHTNVPHMVKPRLVYISNSTEVGTVYQKEELEELSRFCRKQNLYLFLDGARLGNALVADQNRTKVSEIEEPSCLAPTLPCPSPGGEGVETAGVTELKFSDLPRLCDAFTIGGTKNGALFGEAIIVSHPLVKEEFPFHLKQRGALLAKGWILGVQFRELFRDDLYFELARHANRTALRMAEAFRNRGISFLTEPQTNQIFPILPEPMIQKLLTRYDFYRWKRIDQDHTAVRLVTSWATPEHVVEEFIQLFLSIGTD
ncbi:MAG: low specificity L-threonine aldolase [Spirochaetales bacterium]